MVVSLREFIFVGVGAVVLSLVVLAAIMPWTRQTRTLAAIAVATAIGIILWNLALNVTNASALNVDSPLLGLSVQDVGSGVGAFIATLLVLRFVTNREEPIGRILVASAIVGIITIVVDLLG
jgi:membrane protein implicated in regulation of membrane protease activity